MIFLLTRHSLDYIWFGILTDNNIIGLHGEFGGAMKGKFICSDITIPLGVIMPTSGLAFRSVYMSRSCIVRD